MVLGNGEEFGNYRIEEHIAKGGQANVYRAVPKQGGTTVALKIFHAELSPADVERFLKEIVAIRKLEGPNIIPMLAWGEEDFPASAARDHQDDGGNKRLYLAMHYVDRGDYARADLRAVLDKDGPLDPSVALALLWPVARALERAHQEGLVHKDVKPSNILVDRGSAGLMHSPVFLADFGITQRETVVSVDGESGFSGTLPYIAPEQLAGTSPTARADIYALACVAFEMLTDKPPYYDGVDPGVTQVIAAIRNSPTPRLTDHQQDLRHVTDQQAMAADRVLAKALDKNPDQRHETAVQFMQALEKALFPTPPPPTPQAGWWRSKIRQHKKRVAIVAAILVVAAIAAGVLIVSHPTWKTHEPTADAPVQLKYPASWEQFDQPGAYSLFAETDWREFFVDNPSPEVWARFVHGLYQDPESLVGLLALRLDEPARGALAEQHQRLTDMLPGRVSWTRDEANEIEIDQQQARWFTGVLRPPDSSAALRLRAVFIEQPEIPQASETGSVVLLFFAPSPSLDDYSPTAAFGQWRDRFVEMQESAQPKAH